MTFLPSRAGTGLLGWQAQWEWLDPTPHPSIRSSVTENVTVQELTPFPPKSQLTLPSAGDPGARQTPTGQPSPRNSRGNRDGWVRVGQMWPGPLVAHLEQGEKGRGTRGQGGNTGPVSLPTWTHTTFSESYLGTAVLKHPQAKATEEPMLNTGRSC